MGDKLFRLRIRLPDGMCIIDAWDGEHTGEYGHRRIDAELRFQGKVIFPRGATYCGLPAFVPLDSNHGRELVLSLFAMKPGDTDDEYFADYTPKQLEFARKYGDELSIEAEERYPECR